MPAATLPMRGLRRNGARPTDHIYRFIVSPRTPARGPTSGLHRDLGKADGGSISARGCYWVSVAHWNTRQPSRPSSSRGVDEDRDDLVISRDYISRGLRSRAERIVSIELGPNRSDEIRNSWRGKSRTERWTRPNKEIGLEADETGYRSFARESITVDPRPATEMVGRFSTLRGGPCSNSSRQGSGWCGIEARA